MLFKSVCSIKRLHLYNVLNFLMCVICAPVDLLQQTNSAEYRAACRLLSVFQATKNDLLQGGDGEEAEDDEEGEDAENPSVSMEEEVRFHNFLSVCICQLFCLYASKLMFFST